MVGAGVVDMGAAKLGLQRWGRSAGVGVEGMAVDVGVVVVEVAKLGWGW